MQTFSMEQANELLEKWQDKLRLRDWTIKIHEVMQDWRKNGDIKIDQDDKQAVLMINNYNPRIQNLEALIVHELLHLKLWGMDQMIEGYLEMVFGNDPKDPKYNFALRAFMEVLEPTVEDLAKGFIELGGEDKSVDFGRIQSQIDKELS